MTALLIRLELGRSLLAQECVAPSEPSLIGCWEVKHRIWVCSRSAVAWGRLFAVGHPLLFAVGGGAAASWGQGSKASPSVARPLGGLPCQGSGRSTSSPRPSSPWERPGSPLGRSWQLSPYAIVRTVIAAGAAPVGLPPRHSVWSAPRRCRIPASLRAAAIRARALPRRLALVRPQARSTDPARHHTSSVGAPS